MKRAILFILDVILQAIFFLSLYVFLLYIDFLIH